MAEADAEHRDAAEELGDLRDLVDVVRRVAGAVGEHDAVIPGGEDILRFGRAGQHRHGAAAAAEIPGNAAQAAVGIVGGLALYFALSKVPQIRDFSEAALAKKQK